MKVPFYAGTKKQCWYPPHFYGTNPTTPMVWVPCPCCWYHKPTQITQPHGTNPRHQPHGTNPRYQPHLYGANNKGGAVVVVVVVVVGTVPSGRGSLYIGCALGLGLGLGLGWVSRGLVP